MLGAAESAAGKSSVADRVRAQSCWLDQEAGETHCGCWRGPVREGASSDEVSLGVRRLHEAWAAGPGAAVGSAGGSGLGAAESGSGSGT